MLSLVPRSIAKRNVRKDRTNPSNTVVKPFPVASSDHAPADTPDGTVLDDDRRFIVTLVTCTITHCSISDDFSIKLRTPQGYVSISVLLQELVSRKTLTPAAVAIALTKASELYKVRLAKVKTVKPIPDDNGNGDLQGGGYEFQFLERQQRARREEEELAKSSVVFENVPPRYAYGKEGILELLSSIDSSLVDTNIVHGIGSILADAVSQGQINLNDPLSMRHVVVVFDSEEKATSTLMALSCRDSRGRSISSIGEDLRVLGCRARSIHQIQSLRKEYLQYQALVNHLSSQVPESDAEELVEPHIAKQSSPQQLGEAVSPAAEYPLGCLLYLQNLPDNTNKTELKAKLDVFLRDGKVDYVDWKKGQISAHVRVVKAAHARMIIEGLKETGGQNSMRAELLDGKREEIYWIKLPDKIRIAALRGQTDV